MEGPADDHIYATVNSIKIENKVDRMKSPSTNLSETNNHRSSHGHHYPSHGAHSSLSPAPNSGHSLHSSSDNDKGYHRDERIHSHGHHHGSRKMKQHDQNYYLPDYEPGISKRVTPMWSPSSDISNNYRDQTLNTNSQQRQASQHSATQAEIEKLDDLLQELTPRLNDSPSEYSRRRRQSFSSSSKISAYEGRNRQDTFIQGFSPTSPIEGQEKNVLMYDMYDQKQIMSASLARAPIVERSNSQSDLDMFPRPARHSSWHSEEKKRLQRTRSLLDEKDKYLTEQLRRIQARTGMRDFRDIRNGNGISPIGHSPGSSQHIRGDKYFLYNNNSGKDISTVSDWDDVRLFSDQNMSHNIRRAASELDYPLRDPVIEKINNSSVAGLAARRRPLIRNYSDREEFSVVRQRHNSDNHASRSGSANRSYSPITNYRYLNGSPAQPGIPIDVTDDIPLMQIRNIRTNIHSTSLVSNSLLNQDTMTGIKSRDRNAESLPIHHASQVSGPLSPTVANVDISAMTFAKPKETERSSRPAHDVLTKTRNSGFQIRTDNANKTSGISYHDPDEAYLSSDSYPLVSRLALSQNSSDQQTNNKTSQPSNQRKGHSIRHPRPEDVHNQGVTDKEPDSMTNQDPNNGRPFNFAPKHGNVHNSQNSSLRKSAKIWYQSTVSREEAVRILKEKPPGSFIVRQSHTFNNSYGLAVKVPRSTSAEDDDRCVRHFLIECNNKGVRIRGCSNEPYFGSLTALVHQHTLTKLALPCCLILPQIDSDFDDQQQPPLDSCSKSNAPKVSSLFSPKTFSALYLGSIDTESLTGAAALNRAMEILLENRSEVKQTEVSIRISPEGLTLTDVMRKFFFRRHYPLHSISYCGIENTAHWDSNEIRMRGIAKSKIFGFVARKTGTSENMCHLLCEWHPQDSARSITNFISCCVPGT